MPENAAKRNPNLPPMHPGEFVTEVVENLGMPVSMIAKALGTSRRHLCAIMNERRPVTPALAAHLSNLCGYGPELWMRLQATYDAAKRNRRGRLIR